MDIDVAVRLAEEGVPLRAIARAVRIASGDLREHLREAQRQGQLANLPIADDWPAGCRREERALRVRPPKSKDSQQLAVQRAFTLTKAQATLLMTMVQRGTVPSSALTTVVVCTLRKRLKEFGIGIVTLWGEGYRLSSDDRRRALKLIGIPANT